MGNGGVSKPVPCNEEQGTASENVVAYSNYRNTVSCANYIYGVYTGVQWQCVEFARRWLLLRKSCIFSDIDIASKIWQHVTFVECVTDGKKFRLIPHPNGSKKIPQRDSFLIYPRTRNMRAGHIAVITYVDETCVFIAEQNRGFHCWSGNYARQIPFNVIDGNYYLNDKYNLYGWMEIENNDQLQPLNKSRVHLILKKYQLDYA